jgi:mannose-6-phosphate isomerase-like protein (cupin superfamily)
MENSGYTTDIEQLTLENRDFRRVLYTGPHSQLVAMSLRTGEEIGLEVHPENDQFFRIEAGEGEVVIEGKSTPVRDGSAVVVPAGAEHNLRNTSSTEALKLYTIYSPAHHPDGTVHTTKAEAEAAEMHE